MSHDTTSSVEILPKQHLAYRGANIRVLHLFLRLESELQTDKNLTLCHVFFTTSTNFNMTKCKGLNYVSEIQTLAPKTKLIRSSLTAYKSTSSST